MSDTEGITEEPNPNESKEQILQKDDVKSDVEKVSQEEVEEEEEEEEEPTDEEFLSKELYVDFRTLFHTMDADGSEEIGLRELTKSLDEVKQFSDMFGVTLQTDAKCFKKIDKDRTGLISPFELLRVLLPNIPQHKIKSAMQKYEKIWKNALEIIKSDEADQQQSEQQSQTEEDIEVDSQASSAGPDFLPKDLYIEFREILYSIGTTRSNELRLKSLCDSKTEVSQLSDLFGVQLQTDIKSLKKIDKDRTGLISPFELLREFLPGIQQHLIKSAMKKYEPAWNSHKKELIAAAEEEEEEEEEDNDNTDADESQNDNSNPLNQLLVVDVDVYLYCKQAFETMDEDRSGEIGIREISHYVRQHGSPFTGNIDWKLLDRDRNGYCSYEEFLRASYPTEPTWKIKKDLMVLYETHGKPETITTNKKTVLNQTRLRKSKTPEPIILSQLSGGLQVIKATSYDRRIKQLEHRLATAEREQRAFEKARRPLRNPLSEAQQLSLNNKLYYYQLERLQEAEKVRNEKLCDELHPSQLRWFNHDKLSTDKVAILNTRLYDDPVVARVEKRQQLDSILQEPLSPQKVIDSEELVISVGRLYTSDIANRKERREILSKTLCGSGPTPRVSSPEACLLSSKRLYTEGIERKNKKIQLLRKKYILDAQLPVVKLKRDQQAKMIGRLAGI